jgi:cytochrome c2
MSRVLRLLPPAALLVIASMALSQDRDDFKPGRFYQDKCSACHVIPDPAQRTDRAWTERVLLTT